MHVDESRETRDHSPARMMTKTMQGLLLFVFIFFHIIFRSNHFRVHYFQFFYFFYYFFFV
jgi:hypothetical protein